MNDFIELRRVIAIILRRWWLLVVLTALATLLGYTISHRQTPVYQATTTVLVGQILQATNLDRQDILTSDLVALTYTDMIRRQPVLQGVVDSLSLNQTWQQLKRQVRVELVEGTQLIQITVEAGSPEAAQTIADEVVSQFILFSPDELQNQESEDTQLFVQQQIENLRTRIETGQDKLVELQREMVTTESAERLSELQTEVNTLESLITDWENNYTQLLVFLKSGQSPNTLTIIEPAQANPKPVRPQVQLFMLISGGVGMFLALGLIFLLEYLYDALKTPEEITQELGLPVIGFIGDTRDYGKDENGIFVSRHPRSPIAEAYRSLRANLEFVGVDKPLKTILITSCDSGVGKSSVSANLTAVIAQGEKKVILLDADLRKSGIHELMGLPNNIGLSDILINGMDVSEALQAWESEKVSVITGGTAAHNPSELIGSKKMDNILAKLEEITDVIIIDGPPFIVSDALLLAAKVDGVLLVIEPGYTRKKFVQAMIEQLNRAGARIIGVVLNRIPRRGTEYYGDFLYYSLYDKNGYYTNDEDVNEKDGVKGGKLNSQRKKGRGVIKPESIKLFASKVQDKIAAIRKYKLELFNVSIKSVDQLENATGLMLIGSIRKIGTITKIRAKRRSKNIGLVFLDYPESPTAENYRILGTRLLSKMKRYGKEPDLLVSEKKDSDEKRSLKSLLISSSQVGDDNREFAANLAVVLAQANQRVVLVDADLKNPIVNRLLDLDDQSGLADLLLNSDEDVGSSLVPWLNNLLILTSGCDLGDDKCRSFELLASNRMKDIIRELEKKVDIVIISTPPLLSSANSLMLASYVDGVVIVSREGKKARERIREAIDFLRELNVHVMGTVFDQNRPARTLRANKKKDYKRVGVKVDYERAGMKKEYMSPAVRDFYS